MTTFNVFKKCGTTVNVEARTFESHNGYFRFIGANTTTTVLFSDANVAQIEEGPAPNDTRIRITQKKHLTRIRIDRNRR